MTRDRIAGPVTHEVKADSAPFDAMWRGVKTCEVRTNDRDYRVGDELFIAEQVSRDGQLTGRYLRRSITHILTGYGLPDGLCVLSLGARRGISPPVLDAPPQVPRRARTVQNAS